MKLRTRLSRLVTAGSVVVGLAAAGVTLAGSASAATTPPWEPDPNASLGSIVFYNAAGNVITSGNNLNHLFDYAMASTNSSRTTTNAQAVFAFPDHTKPDTTTWHKDAATAATTYPNTGSGVPTSISSSTKPVATATSADANLQALLGSTTLDTTSGYANLVQIQLHDSGSGLGNGYQSKPFWATDIMYDPNAGTWQQVYPATAQSTSTSLSVSPANGTTPNSAITLSATVTPSAAAGTVQFEDGSTNLGTPVTVSGGSAQTTTSFPTTGSHAFTAVFTPSDSTAYRGSTSAPVNYVVGDATSLSIGKSVTISYGQSTSVSGTLTDTTAGRPAASQTVFIYHRASSTAAWIKGSSATTDSTGKVSFIAKPTARTLYQLRFPGTSTLLPAISGTETVSVNQLVSINLTPATIAHGKTFAVWGAVTPSASGRTVTLQVKSGTSFNTVGTTTTKSQLLPNGKTGVGYVFHTSQRTAGSYVYRVLVAATSTLGGATSGSVTEHVS